ncbi:hypothetical protein BDR04DRAFT_1090681 [Suillus decipiens]|nr:hypothetical protein BDR04DRAFT_1090681 [Suillus decipiens]
MCCCEISRFQRVRLEPAVRLALGYGINVDCPTLVTVQLRTKDHSAGWLCSRASTPSGNLY